MTYAEKLKDPRWQKKRLEIMQRDNFACLNCCSKDKTLNVHHVIYVKGLDPWDYGDSLLTLCEECHAERQNAQNQLLLATAGFKNDQLSKLASFIGSFFDIHFDEEPKQYAN